MLKLNRYRPLPDLVSNGIISLLTDTLVLLISYNLGWVLILVRISSRLTAIKKFGQLISNLQLLLLIANVVIVMWLIEFALVVKRFKGFKSEIILE